jgi:hypothetical protein
MGRMVCLLTNFQMQELIWKTSPNVCATRRTTTECSVCSVCSQRDVNLPTAHPVSRVPQRTVRSTRLTEM